MFLSKSRHGYYYIWYTDDRGNRRKVSTHCKVKSDALKALRGFNERHTKKPTILLSRFVNDFLQYATSTYARSTVDLYQRSFRNLLGRSSDLPLHRITARQLDDYKAWRASRAKPVTVNMELRAIKAAFNTAIRWQLIDANPCNGIGQLPVPQQVPCYVSPAEVKGLLLEIKEEWLRQIVWFAVLTGMRQGEILHLRWSDVEPARRLLQVQSNATFRTKQGKRRTIPLSSPAMEVLHERWEKRSNDYVFNLNGRSILGNWVQHLFKRYIRLAGLDDRLHFHSLRHTFASWLVQNGSTLYEVQQLLGHSSPRVTAIYSHLQPEHLRNSVDRISRLID